MTPGTTPRRRSPPILRRSRPRQAVDATLGTAAAPQDESDIAAMRAAMVTRVRDAGDVRPGPVSEALLALPREVLMPQAYVRRTADDEEPRRWDVLDWAIPADRGELAQVPRPPSYLRGQAARV